MGQSRDFLLRMGKYLEAEKLGSQVLETRRRTLGPQHPDTLNAMEQLPLPSATKVMAPLFGV